MCNTEKSQRATFFPIGNRRCTSKEVRIRMNSQESLVTSSMPTEVWTKTKRSSQHDVIQSSLQLHQKPSKPTLSNRTTTVSTISGLQELQSHKITTAGSYQNFSRDAASTGYSPRTGMHVESKLVDNQHISSVNKFSKTHSRFPSTF